MASMNLVLCTLLVQAAALQLKQKKEKPVCDSAEQMEVSGQWRMMSKTERDKQTKETACWTVAPNIGKARDLVWEPGTCYLPALAKKISAKPQHVVFLGDSVTDASAESFAWFYAKQDKKSCQSGWKEEHLRKQPYMSENLLHETLKWVAFQEKNTRHPFWGCNETVSYVPLHGMGDMAKDPYQAKPPSVKALMSLVRSMPGKKLGKDDFIVLNQGLHFHGNSMKDEWGPALREVLEEWKLWQKEGDAPKLIWRQVSPQHWNTFDGGYVEKNSDKQYTCQKFKITKILELKHKKDSSTLREKSDEYFYDAVAKEGLKVDNKNLAFLPVWQTSAMREDDHPAMHWQYKDTKFKQLMQDGRGRVPLDCSHFCVHGAVNRFWNSALLTTMGQMQKNSKI